MWKKALVNMFPQFGEMVQKGLYKQQDADECFQGMLDVVYPHLIYEVIILYFSMY